MIFKHPQRKSVLHESREPYPCHTFRNDAADFFTPSCNFEATHAQRCNSCRSGACPNVQIHYPCRLRRRQEPPKNLAIITARPETRLVRLAKRYASQPHAAAPATPEGKRRNRAKSPHPPGPPNMVLSFEKTGGPGRGLGIRYRPDPCLSVSSFAVFRSETEHWYCLYLNAHHAGLGGGGLPLPAAASAAPF